MKRRKIWAAAALMIGMLTGMARPLCVSAEEAVKADILAKDGKPFDTRVAEGPKTSEEGEEATKRAYEMEVASNTWSGWPKGPQTYGEGGIVMDVESGAILYAKNIDGKAFPASITKLLTTLVALENGNLDEKITVTDDCINCLEYGFAHIGLRTGEELTLRDTLYAVLLASANEAAYAVGENVGEGYEWFLQRMNDRTKELGGMNSNFLNTNGMDDPEHYTTARDMALITRELLRNHPEFEEISQTMQYTIPATNKVNETRTFQQKHQMFYEGSDYYDARVIAGKTGYTDLAMNTLVTCADDGNRKLICVVLKTHGKHVYSDTKALLDYGFGNFKEVSISENEKSVDIGKVEEDAYVLLPEGVNFQDLKMELAKDEENKNSGVVTYTYEGNVVGSAPVELISSDVSEESVQIKEDNPVEKIKEAIPKWVYWTLGAMGILAVLLIIWIIIATAIRRKRRKERMRRRQMRRRRQRRR